MKSNRGRKHPSRTWASALAIILIILLMSAGNVFGNDTVEEPLRLVGILKSVNFETGSIVIDVMTEGCRGERTFTFDPEEDTVFSPDLRGKRVEFLINSNQCSDRSTYKIILPEGR
jgi:hypothetical protein